MPAPELETLWSDEQVDAAADRLVAGECLPLEAFALPKSDVRRLLRKTFDVTRLESGPLRRYALRAHTADQVSRLLLRFGISCNLTGDGEWIDLVVDDPDDVVRLAGQIESGLDGDAAAAAVHEELSRRPESAARSELAGPLRAALENESTALGSVAAVLDDRDLDLAATNDVSWDAVLEIVRDGVEEVFDATVVGTHNFVADGIAVHNSIEQDADMVVLLHREDAYEKESPRAGEADFIVAKHRNGPTATITVAFQGHYSRFVDMSPA